jgi:hypothetical protein
VIYKFKSKASGDVIMLAAQGDRLLRLLGRAPSARGIIAAETLPAAIAALEAAIAAAEAAAARGVQSERPADGEPPLEPGETPVTLRQRLWPMIEMLRRSAAAGVPVVWGV